MQQFISEKKFGSIIYNCLWELEFLENATLFLGKVNSFNYFKALLVLQNNFEFYSDEGKLFSGLIFNLT